MLRIRYNIYRKKSSDREQITIFSEYASRKRNLLKLEALRGSVSPHLQYIENRSLSLLLLLYIIILQYRKDLHNYIFSRPQEITYSQLYYGGDTLW